MGRFINADAFVSTGQGLLGNNMFSYCNSNPVVYVDPEGFAPWPTTKVMQDGFCGGLGGIYSGARDGLTLLTLMSIIKGALESIAEIKQSIEAAQKTSTIKGPYSVYVLVDDNDTVQYVGRTKNIKAREAAHKANPFRSSLRLVTIASNLTYMQARGLEQTLMYYYHTLNPSDAKNNQINGISHTNGNKDDYIAAAGAISGYVWNQISNEVLSWAGV